jgi:hypothetical protein
MRMLLLLKVQQLYRLLSDSELLLFLIEHSAMRTRGGGRVDVYILLVFLASIDRLSDLVVRVPGYRSRRSCFDSWRYQIFWVWNGAHSAL